MTNKPFNSNGEINAYDKADAMSQMVRLANLISGQPSNSGAASTSTYSDEAKEQMLKQAMSSEQGKIALAQSMANPIRRNLDYMGVGRKALVVDPLPQGALPMYEKDIDVAATVISSHGSAPESYVQGERIMVPEFEVVSNPTVRIAEVKRRRFNIIDRAQQKARQEIQAQEDINIFSAIDYASDSALGGENAAVSYKDNTKGLQMQDLLNVKKAVDGHDLVTSKYFMNIDQFTDILGWAATASVQYGGFDPVTTREVLQTGLYGSIWGADIIVSKLVPEKTVYGMAEPEFVGVFPVRQDIEVLPADEPKKLQLGWVVSEIVGVGILNTRGVASLRDK
jgi:hypothetical protein